MLSGKSVGILSSTLPEQSTVTPSEVSVHLQTLGHEYTTPTSKLTTTIAVLRNCILRRQSTNIKKYFFNNVQYCYSCIKKIYGEIYNTIIYIENNT